MRTNCAGRLCLYVNSDTNGRGFLQAGGSHSLQELVNEVAAAIRDPETGATCIGTAAGEDPGGCEAGERAEAEESGEAKRLQAGEAPALGALGLARITLPFLQHLGWRRWTSDTGARTRTRAFITRFMIRLTIT